MPLTLGETWLMDEATLQAGYRAGATGLPEPLATCCPREFWVGWQLGEADQRDELLDPRHVHCDYLHAQLVTAQAYLH